MGNEKSTAKGSKSPLGGMLTASIALGEDIESVALFEDIEEQVVEEEEIDDSPPDPRKKVLMLGCGDSGIKAHIPLTNRKNNILQTCQSRYYKQ